MDNVHLPYTLQTCAGMVCNGGRPLERLQPEQDAKPAFKTSHWAFGSPNLPKDHTLPAYRDHDWTKAQIIPDIAEACLRQNKSISPLKTKLLIDRNIFLRFSHNINACRSKITVHELMTFLSTRTRLDLEQGAAAVVSALFNDGRVNDAARLVRELGGLLSSSSMWIEPSRILPSRAGSTAALTHLAEKLQFICAKTGINIPFLGTYSTILPVLLRVRRHVPADRCLHIPEWIFGEAGLQPPEYMQTFYAAQFSLDERGERTNIAKGRLFPTLPRKEGTIVFSRKAFNVIQRRIFRLYRFWKPEVQLRRSILKLEDEVLYASTWMKDRLRETDDVAQVAFWFFALQRRLQLKVVSDFGRDAFLIKGEGAKLFQNNPRIRSTFEKVLAEIAGQSGTDTWATGCDTMALVDQTCLLMKTYVDVYGNGKKEGLVFHKGNPGGGGRGPVDEYNLLCDVLKELKDRAKDEGIEKVPGPVYKFLAKDIMQWNSAWSDDAFAGGKIHGWELWIAERQLAGELRASQGC